MNEELPISSDLITVLQQSIGWSLSKEILADITEGRIFSPLFVPGCVTELTYEENGKLDTVTIGTITLKSVPDDSTKSPSSNASNLFLLTNLIEFQNKLEDAAKFGQAVSLLINTDKKIVRLSVFPCQCQCDKEKTDPLVLASTRGNCHYTVTYPNGSKAHYVAPCP
jgi:hypothetical protein